MVEAKVEVEGVRHGAWASDPLTYFRTHKKGVKIQIPGTLPGKFVFPKNQMTPS